MLRRIGLSGLDLIYPPSCFLCGRPLDDHRYICSQCKERFDSIQPPICERCGKPTEGIRLCERCSREDRGFFLARSYGYFRPRDPLGRAIIGLKYEKEKALAKELAPLFTEGTTNELVNLSSSITYVPQTKKKRKERGFNQAHLLAKYLGELVDLPVKDLLYKRRETPPQVSLNRGERLENLEDAFSVSGEASSEPLLLVDDVFTTGTTLSECSKTLKRAGFQTVYAVTLARATLPSRNFNEGV